MNHEEPRIPKTKFTDILPNSKYRTTNQLYCSLNLQLNNTQKFTRKSIIFQNVEVLKMNRCTTPALSQIKTSRHCAFSLVRLALKRTLLEVVL